MRTLQVPRRFVRHAWGGTETVILETSRRLPGLGHETEILCRNPLADADEETVDGVRVRRTGYFYPYLGLSVEAKAQLDRKAGNLVSFSLLRELLTRPGLDLVHLHTGKRLGGMVRTAARARGIPYVVFLHGGVHDVPAEEARTWTEPAAGAWEWGKALGWCFGSRRVLDDAAAILCVGEGERRLTQARYPAKRVEYLPNKKLSGSLNFSCIIEGKIVRVYNGSSWDIEYSTNPAWVMYHIFTQPVIKDDLSGVWRYDGYDPSNMDYLAFSEYADYCDEDVPDGLVGSQLTQIAAAGASTIYVEDTTGFSASGTGYIFDTTQNNKDAISWTGKSGTTLTGCTGVLYHTVGAWVGPEQT